MVCLKKFAILRLFVKENVLCEKSLAFLSCASACLSHALAGRHQNDESQTPLTHVLIGFDMLAVGNPHVYFLDEGMKTSELSRAISHEISGVEESEQAQRIYGIPG
jgi:hypothetical protein